MYEFMEKYFFNVVDEIDFFKMDMFMMLSNL